MVAHIKGVASRGIVDDAYELLKSMEHRAGVGAQPNSGDGAGILTALPYAFLSRVVESDLGIKLPESKKLGAGVVFLPKEEKERAHCKQAVEALVHEHGQRLIGWRVVPVAPEKADIGIAARTSEPFIEQLLVEAADDIDQDAFERKLYLIRKNASHLLRTDTTLAQAKMFYICSLSSRVMIYKGMLRTLQLMDYYVDLQESDYVTHLAMVHARFSTNTFPSWDRAHPMRLIAHNGEINTFRGNRNWMRAREGTMRSELFGEDLGSIFPVIEPDCSDTSGLDNALDFLLVTGRTLPESVLMMIPEAWQKHESMDAEKRAFYEYHSSMMEPWDGPSSVTFTDGRCIGAVLDRNGLRPSRYCVTTDDRVIMASEVGVLTLDPKIIREKGRLQPGRMFLVDFEKGCLVPDEEIKSDLARQRPYQQWLTHQRIELSELPKPSQIPGLDESALIPRLRAFGYTRESLHFMLIPLVNEERDPIGSMGNDSALACLSDQPRLPYDYFKQLFAQVTNPAIDSIREDVIMSLECYIGPEQNLLEATQAHCHRLRLPHPILTHENMAAIKTLDYRGWRSQVIDITFDRHEGNDGLRPAIDRICTEAEQAADAGVNLVVLSDRAVGHDRVAVSTLLAAGAAHQHLVRCAKRTRIGLIVETGEASEVHHHCLLVGFGVDAIHPYLAFEALWHARREGKLAAEKFPDDASVVKAYRKGVAKGMLKVMGKMGISTLQSYKGAQIFEAVGLRDDVIELCFTETASRLQGVGFDVLADEMLRRHELGYPEVPRDNVVTLPNPGEYHWRSGGRKHAWEPKSIATLQRATRQNSQEAYREFADAINSEATGRCTLRGLMQLREGIAGSAVPIEEVESAAEIVKRFCTGAMSFGSISPEAHETLAIAMNRVGGKSNTGEGGEDPQRFKPLPNGDLKRSAIKQVASGRFGVTAWYLANADEIQIKISQGAKPGEGGELPGTKVDETIARIRYSTPGVGLISPPPHHDIYSIEDLAQLIYDLKQINPDAKVCVKLVASTGIGTIAAGVAKAKADSILVSGHGGGTGASPQSSIKYAGLPWEMGLSEVHQVLSMNDLRNKVVLRADGGLKTGRDVVMAAMLGADEYGIGTSSLIAMGCIMVRQCHSNTCPVGVCTQRDDLRAKFEGTPEKVVQLFTHLAEEVREILAGLGFTSLQQVIGRTDLLTQVSRGDEALDDLDLNPILVRADGEDELTSSRGGPRTEVPDTLDAQMVVDAKLALENGSKMQLSYNVENTQRAIGTRLSSHIVRRFGMTGLREGHILVRLRGSAGQSLGAFATQGLRLDVIGDANDYVGKGLSGGMIVVRPSAAVSFVASANTIIGNTVLYGATSGKLFAAGQAGERLCVRNSGATAVVEGSGSNACEYMTGGKVVILGEVGDNFGAGMTGGMAFIYDEAGTFESRVNPESLQLGRIAHPHWETVLRDLVAEHARETESALAARILNQWDTAVANFWQVVPTEIIPVLDVPLSVEDDLSETA